MVNVKRILSFTFQFLVRLYISLYFTVSIVNQEFTFQFLVRLYINDDFSKFNNSE